MSSALEAGDLEHTPLAAILVDALRRRASGVLTISHGGGISRLFLRDGAPAGAQAYQVFRPLGQILLAQGRIDVETLDRSLSEMARTGRRQGEILVEMGTIAPEEVGRALAEQQAGYIRAIASLTSGTYTFDPAAPVPGWTDAVRLSPLRLLVDALEQAQAEPLVAGALRQASSGGIALAGAYARSAAAFGWSADEAQLVRRLASGVTLDELFADLPVSAEHARAIVAALLLVGLAEPARALRTTPPPLILDLADLGAVPMAGAVPDPPSGAPASVAPPRRGESEDSRRRRQRLLARAMQNMGVGPLASAPHRGSGSSPESPRSEPASAAAADLELRRALEAAMPRARERDLFARLGIPRSAGRDEVKRAYLQLAKQLHPDRFASPALADLAAAVEELFSAVNEAYETLSDDRRRAEYLARESGGGHVEQARVDFQKAEACMRTRDLARARAFYEAAVRADPTPVHEAALAAALLADPADRERRRAKALLESAMRDAGCDRAFHLAGVLAREEGDDDRAERLLRAALRANPGSVESRRELKLVEARRSAPHRPGAPGK